MTAAPNNENAAQLHFYASLRHEFNPATLQKVTISSPSLIYSLQLAVNLHRKFKQPMYLYWNIVSTWLQVISLINRSKAS